MVIQFLCLPMRQNSSKLRMETFQVCCLHPCPVFYFWNIHKLFKHQTVNNISTFTWSKTVTKSKYTGQIFTALSRRITIEVTNLTRKWISLYLTTSCFEWRLVGFDLHLIVCSSNYLYVVQGKTLKLNTNDVVNINFNRIFSISVILAYIEQLWICFMEQTLQIVGRFSVSDQLCINL